MLVLVIAHEGGPTEVIFHENVSKTHGCTGINAIMDEYLSGSFYIIIVNSGKVEYETVALSYTRLYVLLDATVVVL